MGQITSSVGLVSGINTGDIINQLMAIEAQPVNLLQSRMDDINQQKLAYTGLSTQLASLNINGQSLDKQSTFQNATATSSDESIVTATAATGAAPGSYQVQVAQLVTTQQIISSGYADFNSTKIGAGTITIGVGGGELTTLNSLSSLNGGAGASRGQFRITDRSGNSAIIDTSAAVTLQDVVKKINTSLDIQVHASIKNDSLVLTDTSGQTTGNLVVQDVADGHAADDLGIVGSVASDTLTGTDINYIGTNTQLSQLNDGRGVGSADGGTDFTIQPGDGGAAVNVSIATLTTVGQVINAINTATAGRVTASVSPGDNHLTLTDKSGGTVTVTAAPGSTAASDLGIAGSGTGTVTGSDLISGLGTVLVSSLNGGSGLPLGTISIKDRADTASVDVDLSGAKTVQDILDTINNTAGLHVQASISDAGDGIQIQDTSGGAGLLQIDDANGGTTAQSLGIAGSFDINTPVVNGTDLHRQYVSANTLLSDYNGGKGVATGNVKITNSKGISATISINSNQVSIGDVIQQINARDIGVTASINKNGNGLLLTDSAGGTQKLSVADVDSTTAADLLIAGTSTATGGTTIDGAQEQTIDVTANDTLSSLQTKINNLGFGVTANIINDGTGVSPFRLSLTAQNSGRDGRVIFDTGTTSLNTHNLVEAQNAAVFLGGAGSQQPLLISSSNNQITGAIKGVTLNLNSVSDTPTTVSITQNADTAVDQINQFVTTFNAMITQISQLTAFDSTNNTAGLLLGDSTVQNIQDQIYNALNTVVPNNGKYRLLADVGVTIGDGAQLSFDEDKFRAAYADDPQGVQNLFTATTQTIDPTTGKTVTKNVGIGGVLTDQINSLIDPVSGTITLENADLDQRTLQFQSQIDDLNTLLDSKRARLEDQFANMETVLAQLKTQQSALSSFTPVSSK